jgi:hypothetical protein
MAANGASVVAWPHVFHSPGSHAGIQFRYEDPDGTRHDVAIANGVPSGTVQELDPHVAMAPDGRAIVVWQHSSGGGDQVQYLLVDASGEPVGSPQTLPGSDAHQTPDVGMADDGSALIVWGDNDGTGNEIRTVHIARTALPAPSRSRSTRRARPAPRTGSSPVPSASPWRPTERRPTGHRSPTRGTSAMAAPARTLSPATPTRPPAYSTRRWSRQTRPATRRRSTPSPASSRPTPTATASPTRTTARRTIRRSPSRAEPTPTAMA